MTKPLRPRVSAAITSVGALLALIVLSAAPASAGESNADGFWYYDWYNIQGFHDAGIDGSGVTIAIIDSPVNLDVPTLQGADITPHPPIGCLAADGSELPATSPDFAVASHGTAVASLLVGTGAGYPGQTGVKGIAPGAKLLTYALYDTDVCVTAGLADDPQAEAIYAAVNDGADIISVSTGTLGSSRMGEAILHALTHNVIVVAAVPNQDSNVGFQTAPYSNNGVASIAAARPDGTPVQAIQGGDSEDIETDLIAPGWEILEQGTEAGGWEAQDLGGGTSYATPITSGEIALAIQKYPQATHDQILQSLIHNTGTDAHELTFDSSGKYGYGAVDAISFLAADPTQYDDVNPFIEMHSRAFVVHGEGFDFDDASGFGPSYALIQSTLAKAAQSASPIASPEADPSTQPTAPASPEPSDGSSSSLMWILIGGGGLLIVLIGVGIAIAVTKSRPSKGEHT